MTMEPMDLKAFTEAVNAIGRAECERVNDAPKPLRAETVLAAKHHDYTESVLRPYWLDHFTPEEAYRGIQESLL